MRAICLSLAIFTFALVFSSCANDAPVTTNSSNTFTGDWTVDKVQLVSAPTNGTASAMMKQALTVFGEMSASSAGYLDVKFGGEKLSAANTNLPLYEQFYFVFFNNGGYASSPSYRDSVFVSSDGGINWKAQTMPGREVSYSRMTAPVNENILYTMYDSAFYTGPCKLFKSTNQGDTWFPVNTRMPFNMNSTFAFNGRLYFINENTGFGYGVDSAGLARIWKTTNGGVNWQPVSGTNNDFLRLHFFDEYNAYAESYTDGFKIGVTNDGGATWTRYSIAKEFYGTEIHFINKYTGWIYGYTNNVPEFYKTVDGGATWTKVNGGFYIKSFIFKNENEGYACSDFAILKTIDGGVNWLPCYNNGASAMGVVLMNSTPGFFSPYQVLYKPSGLIDDTFWSAAGRLTNSAIKMITGSDGYQIYAGGVFQHDNIYGRIAFYSMTYSADGRRAGGDGTYYFENGFLYITLNLPNNEVWKIKLKRK